jgi:Cytochrome P450
VAPIVYDGFFSSALKRLVLDELFTFFLYLQISFSRTLFTHRYTSDHARHRRIVGHIYSMNSLTRLETFCDSCTSDLIGLLDAKSGSDPLDMAEVMGWYASDVVGELAFGKSFGTDESCSKTSYLPYIYHRSPAGSKGQR